MHDHADKSWLAELADQCDAEATAGESIIEYPCMLAFGAMLGAVLYDWTQGMAWANALVDFFYQVAPL